MLTLTEQHRVQWFENKDNIVAEQHYDNIILSYGACFRPCDNQLFAANIKASSMFARRLLYSYQFSIQVGNIIS